jgi:hypothetical protein
MKTANEVLLEIVHLKDSAGSHEPERILELLADLARIVVELEHHRVSDAKELPTEVVAADSN